jgi:hypothetical protein
MINSGKSLYYSISSAKGKPFEVNTRNGVVDISHSELDTYLKEMPRSS